MNDLYLSIAFFVMDIFVVTGIFLGITNTVIWAKAWVEDSDFKWWPSLPSGFHDMPMPLVCVLLFPIGYVVGFLWLPAILCGIGYLSLYSLRGFVRLRKKVNKTLSGKEDPNHTHEWEEK